MLKVNSHKSLAFSFYDEFPEFKGMVLKTSIAQFTKDLRAIKIMLNNGLNLLFAAKLTDNGEKSAWESGCCFEIVGPRSMRIPRKCLNSYANIYKTFKEIMPELIEMADEPDYYERVCFTKNVREIFIPLKNGCGISFGAEVTYEDFGWRGWKWYCVLRNHEESHNSEHSEENNEQ